MRVTLTLGKHTVERLRLQARRTGRSVQQAANEALQAGLDVLGKQPKPTKFIVRSRRMGPRPGLNFDNIGELLEQIEDPASDAGRRKEFHAAVKAANRRYGKMLKRLA